MVEIDTDGIVRTWSPAAERIFGWSRKEALGQSLSSMIIPHEHRHGHQLGLRRHLETGESCLTGRLIEFKALTKSGPLLDVEIFIEKIVLDETVYFSSFIRDISDRKMTESKNQALLENIPDLAWFKDRDSRFLAINEAFSRACGIPRHELIGKTDFDVWPEECARGYVLDDKKVIVSRAEHIVTEPLYSSNGRKLWISTIKRPVLDSSGEVIGTVGVSRDVTEMRENQAKLEAITAQQHAIFDAAMIGIFFSKSKNSAERVIHRGNKWLQELFGYSENELVGKSSEILFAREEDYKHLSDSIDGAKGNQNIHLETAFKRTNGSLFWGRITGRALDEAHPEKGYVWLIADISTEKTHQEQVARTQRMEVIGQLAGGLAHDFNNMLGVVIANLDLAAEVEDGSPGQEKYLRIALDAALRGAGVTRKLMTLARKQGQVQVDFDVNQTLLEMRELLQSTIGSDVVLELSLSSSSSICHLDMTAFETAIINLVINARDALLEKPSLDDAIRISTMLVNFDEGDCFLCGLKPGPYVCISISDNGPGMSKQILASAMEAFFTTKSLGSGTGLGLPMVQSFVDASRGLVKIYSEEGFGTTVTLTLPTCGVTTGEVATPWSSGDFSGSGRILLVEDEEALLLATSTWLVSLGYEVVKASSGDEALELFSSDKTCFDLLLTDVVMPGNLDGMQLADEIRDKDKEIRVVYMSGFTGLVSSESRFTSANLLSKPFRKRDLGRIVKTNLAAKPKNLKGVNEDVYQNT